MNFILLLTLTILLSGVHSSGWKYKELKETKEWVSLQPICGHNSQSPINIDTDTLYMNSKLGSLHLNGYRQSLSGGKFVNNGHTVQLNFPSDKTFTLSGKGINGNYTAFQLHFHWTQETSGGSEHTVDGNYYQAEMHIVHIKQPHKVLDEVKDIPDGLAVIGIFLQANKTFANNTAYEPLFDAISYCTFKGYQRNLTNQVSLISLLPKSGSYYRYLGSLTTPPCYESVLWTVYQEPILISAYQLKLLQMLFSEVRKSEIPKTDSTASYKKILNISNEMYEMFYDKTGGNESYDFQEENLGNNYRLVQPLNGRVVSVYNDFKLSKNHTKEESTFGYKGNNGPTHWSSAYPHCKGKKQSPIDFGFCPSSISYDLKPIQLSSSYSNTTSGHVVNNGHTVKFTFDDEIDLEFWEKEKKYRALQLHFHWGKAKLDEKVLSHIGGSEHTIDGNHYPIEMHIVHQKVQKDNNTADDFAVLGVFFKLPEDKEVVSNRTIKAFEKLTKLFHSITYEGQEQNIKQGPRLDDLLPADRSYYRYMGSLTTPPCTEAVMWTVFTAPILITKDIFLEFQSLFKVKKDDIIATNSTDNFATDAVENLDEILLIDNYRPEQDCNDRKVERYVDPEATTSEPKSDVLIIVLMVVVGVVVLVVLVALLASCCKKKDEKEDKKTIYQPVSTRQPAEETV